MKLSRFNNLLVQVWLVITSIETGDPIKEGDPELDEILEGYEALAADYPAECPFDGLSDEEINRLIEDRRNKHD